LSLTAEQKATRAQGLGSSDISAVCGLNPWRKPIDVWLEKTGRSEAREDTAQTQLGERLERQIAEMYAQPRGLELVPGETVVGREPWMISTPDFKVLPGLLEKLLECKNVGYRLVHHWPEGSAPDYVVGQVLWQQEVTGIHAADVAALLGGRDYREVSIPYASDVVGDLVEIGREFWTEHVVKDLPPPVDGSDSWAAYIRSRWPSDLAPPIEATPDADELAHRLTMARAQLESAEADKLECENALKLLIGDAAGVRGKGWSVSWKTNASGGTDWKGLADSLGATAAQIEAFKRPGARVFRFTAKGL